MRYIELEYEKAVLGKGELNIAFLFGENRNENDFYLDKFFCIIIEKYA